MAVRLPERKEPFRQRRIIFLEASDWNGEQDTLSVQQDKFRHKTSNSLDRLTEDGLEEDGELLDDGKDEEEHNTVQLVSADDGDEENELDDNGLVLM